MTIHTRIKQRREFLRLSMEQLAALVGVKAWQTIQQWEKDGGTSPKRERLAAVAKALQTTPQWLMFGHDPEWTPEPNWAPHPSPEGRSVISADTYNALSNGPIPLTYPADTSKFRRVFVVGKAQGGLPDRIWTDGDYPVGATDQYAELASPDPHAFLVPVVGLSMAPRYNPGEFGLVEPGTEPELEDDVLVRLVTGETMIKRLLSRRQGIRLGSYNDPEVLTYAPEEISWMYYIAHPVPARKIKTRM
ncbi:helix-turn-helix domain-containing protein [Cupriavidus sp. KK10]|jgi:transcriptional regulator with XRE-family HTH domain|uniref:S24 family peptidase n=1 Tax=Cupriavidus sp. KK10 TaxID=1478019 RepID=UPI001BA917DE|nr:S24 family peptidase [Cupriavidus sp. KK10]QUN29524.1 helix-turn-helix domain-containing protein [Cupriavidus sp. KK10]